MEFSNAGRWLLVMKDGDVTFEDIRETIDKIPDTEFEYSAKGDKHDVFHMILNDLDLLCKNGEAVRTFEKVNESEVSEVYRITPKGREKAENLGPINQGHQK